MLKTLDPILITIIAMSALGVFLGAICGVVLYCACSHGGMSDRNLSALENYNFELVDGVKLKKDKLNVQSSYSEAWAGDWAHFMWLYDGLSSHWTGCKHIISRTCEEAGSKRLPTPSTHLLWMRVKVQEPMGGLDWSTLFSGAAVKKKKNNLPVGDTV